MRVRKPFLKEQQEILQIAIVVFAGASDRENQTPVNWGTDPKPL